MARCRVIVTNNLGSLSRPKVFGILKSINRGGWISMRDLASASDSKLAGVRSQITMFTRRIAKNVTVEYKQKAKRGGATSVRFTVDRSKA